MTLQDVATGAAAIVGGSGLAVFILLVLEGRPQQGSREGSVSESSAAARQEDRHPDETLEQRFARQNRERASRGGAS